MKLNEYQEKAMTTCMPSSENLSYMLLNLVGEVGEFSSKIAKAIRKRKVYIGKDVANIDYPHSSDMHFNEGMDLSDYLDLTEELQLEAGDILWQLAGLCKVMGWKLEDVAQMNLDKLASRKERGKIDGNGDRR